MNQRKLEEDSDEQIEGFVTKQKRQKPIELQGLSARKNDYVSGQFVG